MCAISFVLAADCFIGICVGERYFGLGQLYDYLQEHSEVFALILAKERPVT